jgi:aryl-alcohol dehydrogenase-like predicted oxidoreductase
MRLSLGTAQIGSNYGLCNSSGIMKFSEAKKIINFAKNNGINSIDTAINYGDSELILGKIGVQDFQVTTKLPEIPCEETNISQWMCQHLEQSLSRLKILKMYSVLLHRPGQLLGPRGIELYEGLQNLKKTGLVEKVGISIYSPDELEPIFKNFYLDQVQAPINAIDRRMISSGWLRKLYDNKVEVHARSIFMQGLLLTSRHDIPMKFSKWNKVWDTWDQWLLTQDISPLDACINYVNSFPEISTLIIGVDSLTQIQDIVSATGFSQSSLQFPKELMSTDLNLINPSNWREL